MKISEQLSNKIANMGIVCAIFVTSIHVFQSDASIGSHQLIIKLTEFVLLQVGFDIKSYADDSAGWWIVMTFVYASAGIAFAFVVRRMLPCLASILFGGR